MTIGSIKYYHYELIWLKALSSWYDIRLYQLYSLSVDIRNKDPISNKELVTSGADHDYIYNDLRVGIYSNMNPLWRYTQSYDSVISIGGVWTLWAEDRLYYYGSSMYMVTVHGEYTIIWISIFYILGIVTW